MPGEISDILNINICADCEPIVRCPVDFYACPSPKLKMRLEMTGMRRACNIVTRTKFRVVRSFGERHGMEWYGWHGFRRGIASNLYELGADEKVVQRILRHAKSHVTKERYIKAFDPAVLAAMRKLETSLDAISQSAPIVHQIN